MINPTNFTGLKTGPKILLLAVGIVVSPWRVGAEEALQPIIARMEMVFSIVAHPLRIPERIGFYNVLGNPKGAANYATPYLVYEPVVTLYNPYNVELRLPKVRVQLADPPVGFKFKKNGQYLRSEWENGDSFEGIGRFNIGNEDDSAARKTFTLILGGGNAGDYAGDVVLQPGETKSFSTRVDANWTWGLETSGGYTPRSFADWYTERDFTNKDGRTSNPMGAEAISGFDPRAGFQSDHLSSRNTRPTATLYSFETERNGWVVIKLTDTFGVDVKGLRTFSGSPQAPDFQLSLLRGLFPTASEDVEKAYSFNVADLVQPPTGGEGIAAISRTVNIGDIVQSAIDVTPQGKLPIAVFAIVAKSKALQRKAFLSEVMVPSEELYEMRLEELSGFSQLGASGPTDHLSAGVEVTGVERQGNLLVVDLAAAPGHGPAWVVRGTADLAAGFGDELTELSRVVEGPVGTGVYKVTIDVSGRGDRYFVQVVE